MLATVAHSNAIKLLGPYEFIIVFLMKKQKAAHSLPHISTGSNHRFYHPISPPLVVSHQRLRYHTNNAMQGQIYHANAMKSLNLAIFDQSNSFDVTRLSNQGILKQTG